MAVNFLKKDVVEQKMLSWGAIGVWVFISAFLWAPSRDGLQGVYALAFFLPMLVLLLLRKPDFTVYGGWISLSALLYAGFSVFSSLWSEEPSGLGFFVFQWIVLAVWLCGSSLLFTQRKFNLQKYLDALVVLGAFFIGITLVYYYFFVFPKTSDIRLNGWNVFRNSNEIGAMCGVVAVLAVVAAFKSLQLTRVYCFYLLAVIACAGLLASFSRAALLAFVITSFCALVIIRPPLKIWLLPLLLVLFTLFMLLMFSNIFDIFYGRELAVTERIYVWQYVLERSHENIIGGIGITKNSNIVVGADHVFNHAHNAWLDIFYRTGLIGLVLALINLVAVIKTMPTHSRLLPLYLWLAYGCICSLFDSRCFFWTIGAKWFFYWIPMGLISASIAASVKASVRKLEK